VVGEAAGRRNDDDSRRWRGCPFFSSSVQSPQSLFFSSLSVLSCFSSPSLVLLALAALMVGGWWGCWWWLGGTMEALVEVQRWLFSSLFCLALSLSSVSQKTIPRLVSLSLLFLFSSSSFSSPFLPRFCSLLPSALQKIYPPSSCLPLSVRLPFSLSPKFFPSPLFVPLFLKKIIPPSFWFCSLPCIYRQPGRGSPYPVQVQGMMAWELQGMVV